MSEFKGTAKGLARLILSMTYGELRSVANSLSGMVEDKDCRPSMETPEDFSELLFDWAAAEVENDE